MSNTRYLNRWKLQQSLAEQNYYLECFGDYLANMHGYPPGIIGFEAIYLYLCEKYDWPVGQSRAMDKGDIRLVLAAEMKGWSLPPEAAVEHVIGHKG